MHILSENQQHLKIFQDHPGEELLAKECNGADDQKWVFDETNPA